MAIARAVILKPKLLLADELTGNLDSQNSAMVMELLVNLNRLTDIAILLVIYYSDAIKPVTFKYRCGRIIFQESSCHYPD